jgi:sulfite reductase (NADPH) flavoprotein alpha-component|tara:strand:+ start:106399 stop:108207 length:1809 start_codon:yes stop_codon:yes gene_type:complete
MPNNPTELPANAPFTPEQKVALSALLPTLTPPQSTWLIGYFGALSQVSGGAAVGQSASAAPKVPLTILYGSESGNSEGCAQKLEAAAKAEGFKTKLVDMGDYGVAQLEKEENILVVVSTWGEGDPPEGATDFYETVMGSSAPKMENTRFAVFALGDTSYADFCKCGMDIDKRFGELGAKRIFDRVDSDVAYEEPFAQWQSGAIAAMVEASGVKNATTAAVPAGVSAAVTSYSKSNPYKAILKESFVLNGADSKKETLHIEIDLGDSGLSYEPGDVVGVFATNSSEVVDDFIRMAGYRGDEIYEADGSKLTLKEVLAEYDITSLSKALMKKYAPLAKNTALDGALDDANAAKTKDWLWGRELRDLFLEYPPTAPLTLDQLLKMLRKQPPRLYSIASSIAAHPGEVHLTIVSVRYNSHGKDRLGVCSTYFADRIELGEAIPIFLHRNKNFKLPQNPETPVIMVGPGTGIAPFRAFVEERAETGAKGKSWLFFGEWTFQDDFLYQTEWQKYLKSGSLTKLDVAFSRDRAEKVYVQHRMAEHGKELYDWLEQGAYFYVCGDASRMAKDVHQTLIDVVAEHGGKSVEEAEAYVKALKKDKRYQRDVY